MTKLKDAAAIANIALGFLFASAFQVPMVTLSATTLRSLPDRRYR